MKKLIYLAASAIALAGLWSCNPEEAVNDITVKGDVEITVPSADVEPVSIAFTAPSDWTAEASDEWVVFSPKSGKAGDAVLKVTVEDNELGETRSLRITITAGKVVKEVTITQEGAFVPYFDVDPSSCQWSGFGEGTPYTIEKEAGEYVIPVSTNLEWDTYLAIWDNELGAAVETDHNGWLTLSKTNGGIKVVVLGNETYDARVEYVYVECHVGDNYDDFGGFGACILVSQAGLPAPTTPTLVWSRQYADINENLAASIYTRLAWSEGEIMLSDGNAVYGLDPASGELWDVFDVKAQSFDSDDEGNLIIMNDIAAEYDDAGSVVGPTALQIKWTPSIYDEPQVLHTMNYANQAWGTLGNFRVRGDIAGGKAVVTAAVGNSRFYYGWAFNEGAYVKTADLDPIRGTLNATGDGSTPDQIGVVSVAPDNLADGIIYRGYVLGQTGTGLDGSADQSTFLRVDPTVPHWSSPEWRFISSLGSGGNECQGNADILDIAGKRILAFTQGGHFGWVGNANIYVLDITNLNDVKVLANIDTEEWIDLETAAAKASRGADVLLRANGDNVELYAVRANGATVAKFVFGLE